MLGRIKRFLNSIRALNTRLIELDRQNTHLKALVNEDIWSSVFNSATTGSEWFSNKPLNVGRWAANYSFLYILFRTLNEIKPENILELGLGETTKMIQAYKERHNQHAFCCSIEQSRKWIEQKRRNGISSQSIEIKQVNVKQIHVKGFESLAYDELPKALRNTRKKFDLVIIDGPWGSDNYSRYNIIELVAEKLLNEDFIIIFDDVDRIGEQQTLDDLQLALKENAYHFTIGFLYGAKSQAIIASEKYEYLTSV